MGLFERVKSAGRAFKSAGGTQMAQWQELADFLGIDYNDSDNMSEATYYTCLKVLSESLGKMPCRLLQRDPEDGGVVVAYDKSIYYTLFNRPNPYVTASVFWSSVEMNRSHFGNAYVLVTGAGTRRSPLNLWLLPSSEVGVIYDDALMLADIPDIYYHYRDKVFGSQEILHFKAHASFDSIIGTSVQDYLRETLSGNIKSQKFINGMYESGFTAKAVLQYTGSLSDENVQKLVRGVDRYARGEINDELRNILPIPVGQTLTPLNIKLTEAQYLEVRQYTSTQIASAFGIKPYQIGDYGKESYSSQTAQQLSFFIDTMLYITKQYEEELAYKLLSPHEIRNGFYFKFDNSGVLKADRQTQIETLSKATSSFLLTPNEARAELDLPALDGADELLGNGASIPVRYAGSQYTDISHDNSGGGETV